MPIDLVQGTLVRNVQHTSCEKRMVWFKRGSLGFPRPMTLRFQENTCMHAYGIICRLGLVVI